MARASSCTVASSTGVVRARRSSPAWSTRANSRLSIVTDRPLASERSASRSSAP